jgi:hypothetical protein
MESLIPPFAAYKGDAPYVFVSYAHKNSVTVFSHITRLHQEGFRIWYDEGIDPGTDWSDEIAVALAQAEIFLVFISQAAIESHNVRKEIVFAIDQKKPMLCVHVEEVDMPLGLKMQLGNIQALLENRFHDKEQFYDRMFNALRPEQTRGTPSPLTNRPLAKQLSFLERHRRKVLLLAGLLLLGIGAACLVPHFFSQTVSFADPRLESALRQELSKKYGSIRPEELSSLKGKISLAGLGLSDIAPLRHLQGVQMLNMENNQIADIAPLAALKELMVLGLGNNCIQDLRPLHALKNTLVGLSIAGNPVKNLQDLRPLVKLEVLDLSGVPITDLDLGMYLRHLKTVILDASGNGLDAESLRQFAAGLPPNCELKLEGGLAQ